MKASLILGDSPKRFLSGFPFIGSLPVLLLSSYQCLVFGLITNYHAKLVLIDENNQRLELSGRQCVAGVYLVKPTVFKCVCVHGVWGLYGKYCDPPIAIVGGENYCFKMPKNTPISQFIVFGNPKYPFDPTITHFRDEFKVFTKFYAIDEKELELDAASSFITIKDHAWEVRSDDGEALCLSGPKKHGKMPTQFCRFSSDDWKFAANSSWSVITELDKGCRPGTTVQNASDCVNILSSTEFPTENGVEVCLNEEIQLQGAAQPQPEPPEPEAQLDFNEKLPSRPVTKNPALFDFNIPLEATTTARPTPTSSPTATSTARSMTTPKPTRSSTARTTTSSKPTTKPATLQSLPLIDFPTEPTFLPPPDTCQKGLSREDVKYYWLNGRETSDCPKSATNAVFLDQLKRFAIIKMSRVFQSRTKSLEQVAELLELVRAIMGATCPGAAVKSEFLDVVLSAFTMFIREDFFYGLEELESLVFERFKFTLNKCLKRARPFIFSMEPRECEHSEITGTLYLPSTGEQKVEVPPASSSANYEPLIEAMWKMFLNVHSFCYQDFLQINDHHHFSTLIIQLFTRTIYEKWVTPLESEDLYKFIVPNTNFLDSTMRNIDYCVGATGYVSACPPWLHRSSNPLSMRKKRSVWAAQVAANRKKAEIWNGTAYCLNNPEEPGFKLGFGRCAHPI